MVRLLACLYSFFFIYKFSSEWVEVMMAASVAIGRVTIGKQHSTFVAAEEI